jgi:hypothetical protein
MKAKAVTVLVLACMPGLQCASSALAQNGDVAVVVSPLNGTSALSLGELRKVFNGEKHFWPSGSMIKLLVRRSGSRERNTLLSLLGMSEIEYKQYWTSQIYRGEAQSEPITLPSNGMQKEALATYPGAIALVDAADVKPGMKVLKINGHMPGEEHYPLH